MLPRWTVRCCSLRHLLRLLLIGFGNASFRRGHGMILLVTLRPARILRPAGRLHRARRRVYRGRPKRCSRSGCPAASPFGVLASERLRRLNCVTSPTPRPEVGKLPCAAGWLTGSSDEGPLVPEKWPICPSNDRLPGCRVAGTWWARALGLWCRPANSMDARPSKAGVFRLRPAPGPRCPSRREMDDEARN